MAFAEAEGAKIYYEQHGSGPAVMLIFLCGERDCVLRSATVRRAHAKVPGSKLAVVPNGPHSLDWEMPEVFNATVRQLLNEVYGCADGRR
jgi:hypothetical protein